MKKILLICFLSVFFCCKAQEQSAIPIGDLTVNDVEILLNNIDTITQTFGQPNSIEDYFFEINDVMGKIYYYDDFELDVLNDAGRTFVITGTGYSVTSHDIKIGDDAIILSSIFPKSYLNRNDTPDGGGILVNFTDADYYFIISWNAAKKINIMYLREY